MIALRTLAILPVWILVLNHMAFGQQAAESVTGSDSFAWPEDKQIALSLSFDDGRASQVEVGVPLFAAYDARVTFYVNPRPVEEQLAGWKRAVSDGHEIGNHTLTHPCTGNFPWAQERALENYSLEAMRREMEESNRQVEALLGVTPVSFAYPCGQTFIGRGQGTQSYVPLVAELFGSGRGWLDEAPNAPGFVDLAQVLGVEMDGKSFEDLLPMLEQAREHGAWLVLAGHEIGTAGRQTTRVDMLKHLIEYAQDPANRVWLAPVGDVARWIDRARGDEGR